MALFREAIEKYLYDRIQKLIKISDSEVVIEDIDLFDEEELFWAIRETINRKHEECMKWMVENPDLDFKTYKKPELVQLKTDIEQLIAKFAPKRQLSM